MVKDELKALEEICRQAKMSEKIAEEHIALLSDVFGRRLESALQVLKERRVKKYVFRPSGRVVWIVVGRKLDYQVMPVSNFCTCDDFYYRVVNGERRLCYHLIAQKLAEASNNYDLIEAEDELYDVFLREWRG